MGIREKARLWLAEHPDEGYQYDQCFDFFNDLTRSELLKILEALASPQSLKDEK